MENKDAREKTTLIKVLKDIPYAIGTFAIISSPFIIGAACIFSDIDETNRREAAANNVYQEYKEALFRYADTNKDGTISDLEHKTFDFRLYENRNVVYASGTPKFSYNNELVPRNVLHTWINEYEVKYSNK